MDQFGSDWMDFHEIWYMSVFRKPVEKIQFALNFTRRSIYISDHISIDSSYNEKFFQTKVSEKSKLAFCVQ